MFCEVAVIGGGPAGVCAALAAAREGADTVLVTDRPVLGGNSSSEVRVWTRGATGGGNLFAEEMGIWGELKLTNLYRNPEGNVLYWDEVLFDAVYAQPRLRLLLNTLATGVRTSAEGENRRIESVSLLGIRTERALCLTARQFVDCTSNGSIARAAGVPCRTGREGRDVFGESLALRQSDQKAQGCSILIQTKRVGKPTPFIPPDYVYSLGEIERMIGRGGRVVTADMQGSDCWWFEYGGQLDTIADDQAIFWELKRIALGIWNYIKNSGKFDADDLALEWIGSLPGRRDSLRLSGRETLLQRDVTENHQMEAAVCYGGWFIDTHPSGGIQSRKEQCKQLPVHCYGIPLGCLYHGAWSNLFFAGRMASMSHVAFSSARIMNTCALMGQAAGTAAAMCAAVPLRPAELHEKRLGELRRRLALADVLPWYAVDIPLPPDDIDATSVRRPEARPDCSSLPLTRPAYVAFPNAEGQAVTIRFQAEAEATLRYWASVTPLPSRRCEPEGAPEELRISAGAQALRFSNANTGFTLLWLEPAPGVALLGGSALPGVQAGYCEEGELFHPLVSLSDGSHYAPANAADGWLRPWNGVHAWVSDGVSESGERLTLKWKSPVVISRVTLMFDPDLSMELPSSRCSAWDAHHHFAARDGMPPCLVKEYRLLARRGERELELCRVRNNFQRRRAHDFDPVKADALILEVSATYGGDAVVYAMLPNL